MEAPAIARVSPEVVEVRMVLVNDGPQPLDVGVRFAQRSEDGASVSGLVLVEDTVPKKSFVLRDARDQPLCSTGLAPLAPGERRAVWARFPAPASPAVTVHVPGLPPLRSVEVPTAGTP